jgi:Ferritin-like
MTDGQGKLPAPRSRRTILKALAASGIAIPSVCLFDEMPAAATVLRSSEPRSQIALASAQTGDPRSATPALPSQDPPPQVTVRQFADPLLELIRLLRNAADMEHAALLQYTYSAFSLKPGYESISGYDSADAMSLLTISIERMTHLGAINRLLVVLGAPPRLVPPAFPLKSDAVPLAFNLEPLSRDALARYIYYEAPQELFEGKDIDSPDGRFVAAIGEMLGAPAVRAASIYIGIVAVASEVSRSSGVELPDITRWTDAMRLLADRGRESRFEFLKDIYLGSHPVFSGRDDVWRLPVTDPGYPSYDIAGHPKAYSGAAAQVPDRTELALARLGDLQYASALLLLDLYFRHHISTFRSLAVTHMTGPVRSIGKYLPRLGVGMPFGAIEIPDSSALDAKRRLRFVLALLQEAQLVAETIGPRLPPDYPLSINRETMTKLREMETRNEPGFTRVQ